MTLLGIDFDNTLVRYDSLFHKLASEQKLISSSMPKDKRQIRDYLRMKGEEERFTLLQGEVYGNRIKEAEPAEGMLETLHVLSKYNIRMVIVSHKTQKPYMGPSYDLHKAAMSWLSKYEFFSENGLNWDKNNVYFLETKEDKIKCATMLGCTHFIDDLPEILEELPSEITKILYYSET